MGRSVSLGGYLLTEEEWRGLDEEHRTELLRAFIETTSARRKSDFYEVYELELSDVS